MLRGLINRSPFVGRGPMWKHLQIVVHMTVPGTGKLYACRI
jgi:hypothetical protein